MKRKILSNVKKLVVTALGVAATASLLACGSTQNADNTQKADASQTAESELKKVILAVPGNDGTMMENALIAQNKKYFEEELEKVGYYPEYQGFPQAGPAVNEAYASEKIDFAVYGDFPAITAKSSGVDIKVLAVSNRAYNHALIVPKDSDIKSVADLKGKKVVIPLGTVHYKWFQEQVEAAGFTVDDVETINSVQDGPSMLATGDADAIITAYIGGANYQVSGIGVIVDDSKDDINSAAEFLLTGRTKFMEENPEVAGALVKALNRAYEYASSNTYDDVIETLKTPSNTTEILKLIYDPDFSYFNPEITQEDKDRLSATISYMKESDLISNDVAIDDFVDDSYFE